MKALPSTILKDTCKYLLQRNAFLHSKFKILDYKIHNNVFTKRVNLFSYCWKRENFL